MIITTINQIKVRKITTVFEAEYLYYFKRVYRLD
jgi:hypothetical protein